MIIYKNIFHFYLKLYPKFHTTKEYLVPRVMGVTLCQVSEGKTIKLPLPPISFTLWGLHFFTS